jgi:hypothetical protein
MATSDIFNTKYTEFCKDLQGTCPELEEFIVKALALSPEKRRQQFKDVLPFCAPNRDGNLRPEMVLPGVMMSAELWNSISPLSKKAIQEYLTLLSFTLLMESGTPGEGGAGAGAEWNAEWAQKMMDEMKSKMSNVDFAGLSEKVFNMFKKAADGTGGIPELPPKFFKGQIAKLAEEIVKEFNIEEFGIDPALMEAYKNDPTKALNVIMEVFMKNPNALQNTIGKLTKKLQQKVQSGQLRPQELVAEAEELMKTFSENPQFVEMMESFRQAFGFEGNEDKARAAGRDGDARLSIVQARLRRKLEAKKAALAPAPAPSAAHAAPAQARHQRKKVAKKAPAEKMI